MANPLRSELMTTEERIAELCALLAAGLIRMNARKSSALSADRGESCLHFPPDQSGHAVTPKRRKA